MNHVAIISQEQPHKHSAAITQIVEECLSEEMFVTLKKGEIHRFCSLLAAGGNPNAVNREGYSLLMVAVKENAEDFVDALVNAVVDINMRGPGGVTAMILAMAGGSYDIARTLLNNFTDLSGIRDGNSARKHGREDIARQVEMAKQSAFYAKKAAEKKKEIERAREEQETKSYFASLSANLTSSFSSAFDTAAAKKKSAKEYVWDIAATTKKKTVAKAKKKATPKRKATKGRR